MSCSARRRISERITSSTAHQGRDAGCRQTADEAALFRVFEELRGPVHESAIAHVDLAQRRLPTPTSTEPKFCVAGQQLSRSAVTTSPTRAAVKARPVRS